MKVDIYCLHFAVEHEKQIVGYHNCVVNMLIGSWRFCKWQNYAIGPPVVLVTVEQLEWILYYYVVQHVYCNISSSGWGRSLENVVRVCSQQDPLFTLSCPSLALQLQHDSVHWTPTCEEK